MGQELRLLRGIPPVKTPEAALLTAQTLRDREGGTASDHGGIAAPAAAEDDQSGRSVTRRSASAQRRTRRFVRADRTGRRAGTKTGMVNLAGARAKQQAQPWMTNSASTGCCGRGDIEKKRPEFVTWAREVKKTDTDVLPPQVGTLHPADAHYNSSAIVACTRARWPVRALHRLLDAGEATGLTVCAGTYLLPLPRSIQAQRTHKAAGRW